MRINYELQFINALFWYTEKVFLMKTTFKTIMQIEKLNLKCLRKKKVSDLSI